MDNARALEALRSIGLDEQVAQVYLALVRRPRMTPSQIARETGLKRPTCYDYIDELLSKDLVTREPYGKRTYYSAAEPLRVLRDFKKRIATVEGAFLEMSAAHEHAANKPKISYFEGKRQLKIIYDEMFRTVGDVRSIFPTGTFFQHFTEKEYDEFDKAISQYSLKSKDLFLADKYYRRIKEIRARNGAANKLDKRLPPWFTCNVDVLIFNDKVALMSLGDLSAVVIENKDIAELFRNMHEFMWKAS